MASANDEESKGLRKIGHGRTIEMTTISDPNGDEEIENAEIAI